LFVHPFTTVLSDASDGFLGNGSGAAGGVRWGCDRIIHEAKTSIIFGLTSGDLSVSRGEIGVRLISVESESVITFVGTGFVGTGFGCLTFFFFYCSDSGGFGFNRRRWRFLGLLFRDRRLSGTGIVFSLVACLAGGGTISPLTRNLACAFANVVLLLNAPAVVRGVGLAAAVEAFVLRAKPCRLSTRETRALTEMFNDTFEERITTGGRVGDGGVVSHAGRRRRIFGKMSREENVLPKEGTGCQKVSGTVLKVGDGGRRKVDTALANEDFLHPWTKDGMIGAATETLECEGLLGCGPDGAPFGLLDLAVKLGHAVEIGPHGFETLLVS
jgi:hypothetical protein